MRFKKKSQTERTLYMYVDENGKKFPLGTIRPGEKGVTEVDIRHLHNVDDYEIECNISSLYLMSPAELKRERKDWKENFSKEFREKNGRDPYYEELKEALDRAFTTYSFVSVEALEEEVGDKSPVLVIEDRPDDSEAQEAIKERIEYLIRNNSDREKEIFKLYIQTQNMVQVAQILGISDSYVCRVVKKIEEILRADKFLRNFFMFGSESEKNRRLEMQEEKI